MPILLLLCTVQPFGIIVIWRFGYIVWNFHASKGPLSELKNKTEIIISKYAMTANHTSLCEIVICKSYHKV